MAPALQPRLDHLRDRLRVYDRLGVRQRERPEVLAASVNGEDLPSNEARRVAEEEDSHVRDVPHIAVSPEWHEGGVVLCGGAFGTQAIHAFCPSDGSGGNHVGTYTL